MDIASPSWSALAAHVKQAGVEPWLTEALDHAASVIAGAMNVLGVGELVMTGSLMELGDPVTDALSAAVARRAMWSRFGQIACRWSPRHWSAGLIAAAIDRVLMPVDGQRIRLSGQETSA
jgi:predicted NBD/HSP70 family sugar kinase